MDKKYILAKNLRKNSTIQEKRLWNILKSRQFHNLKFRRQYPIGAYIVDFVCIEKKLVIELDGGQHNNPDVQEYDTQRTHFIEKAGYKVLRFWNDEVYKNFDGVLKEIEKAILQ